MFIRAVEWLWNIAHWANAGAPTLTSAAAGAYSGSHGGEQSVDLYTLQKPIEVDVTPEFTGGGSKPETWTSKSLKKQPLTNSPKLLLLMWHIV